jgi:catechol-2,3-dioxygenase
MNAAKFAALLFLTMPGWAQLTSFNDSGVRLGHMHLAVKDVDAQKQFWTEMLPGTIVKNGGLEFIQFPGVYIMLRKAEPTGSPEGTIVNHFGLVVKDLESLKAKWKAAGVEFKPAENPKAGYVSAPDGIRVEVFEDPKLPFPATMNHVHFYSPDVKAMQGWYVKVFGVEASERRCVSCVTNVRYMATGNLPGDINLSFAPGKPELVGTKGRSLDHIGFDVKDLDTFAKKMETLGIKFDVAPRQIANSKTKISFITDPWGTYIEVTEGLAP